MIRLKEMKNERIKLFQIFLKIQDCVLISKLEVSVVCVHTC